MLKEYDSNYRTLILLRVVKKLIMSTESYGIYRLEKILKNKVEEELIKKGLIRGKKIPMNSFMKNKQKFQQNYDNGLFASKKINDDFVVAEIDRTVKRRSPPGVPPFVPQRRFVENNQDLPSHLDYLKPIKSEYQIDLDLKKLNPLVKDNNVKLIECEGENESIIVTGSMGRKPTAINLSSEEIKETIDIFSHVSKIPVSEGLFKVTIGHLQFTAMISETISSRFMIRKI